MRHPSDIILAERAAAEQLLAAAADVRTARSHPADLHNAIGRYVDAYGHLKAVSGSHHRAMAVFSAVADPDD